MDSDDIDIRYTSLDDMPYLRQWLKTKDILHWYPPSDDEELENFVRVWMGFTRFSASLSATYKGTPVGMATLYLMPYRKVAHQCMFQIVVDPEYQREGVGRTLMKNLKHLAKSYFRLELMHVEILDESPLIDLLKSLDFEEFARQEKYVKENGVYFPRILMECEL
ncbi:MAG: hypothetical protein K1000chlam2_00705 [Chlamydiae bacterium]|nr:hypothetical protein [Chlamydiota bacterium]